jgi:hypothetical protein
MQVYMRLTGITRALYVAVCKDTDEIHIERVRVDPAAGQRLVAKAKRVIDAPRPPAKISEDPTWWQCRLCEHHDHCHRDRPAERNCRTCLHSTPVDGGWICERWNRALSLGEQQRGCPFHLLIPDLVPGVPIDAGDDWVAYRLTDGSSWIDGAGTVSRPATAETFPWTSPPTRASMAEPWLKAKKP